MYPAIFVLPLMLYVLTGGRGGREFAGRRVLDWLGAVRVGAVALGTAVLVNVPFALAGFEGLKASFTFQLQRKADITTNSIWFWGLRPYSDPDNEPVQELIGVLSPTLMMASFVVACAIGWRRYQKEGTYPWVAVSAAMLCGFLLLHKVHSPQYTLWLVPMFVLLRIRWGWILAYFLADLAMGDRHLPLVLRDLLRQARRHLRRSGRAGGDGRRVGPGRAAGRPVLRVPVRRAPQWTKTRCRRTSARHRPTGRPRSPAEGSPAEGSPSGRGAAEAGDLAG